MTRRVVLYSNDGLEIAILRHDAIISDIIVD